MLTIAATIIGFIALVTTLTLIQVRKGSLFQLSALTSGSLLFLALTTFGLYALLDSQALKIGVVCGAVVVLVNITQLARRRYAALSATSGS